MKLQKFIKNKKIKTTFLASIVALVFVVGGITLYRTFALYQEERTFNVLVGVVPDFSKNTDTYTEELLNGADPVLDEGGKLIPVKINETDGSVTVADTTEDWYKYGEKRWANAVILVDDSQNPEPGDELTEEQIESYFVWIPKYKYKIQTLSTSTTPKAFDIVFGTENTEDKSGECKTPEASVASGTNGNCKVEDYMTHPAFLAFGGNGLWVGKFETGRKSGALTSSKTSYSTSDLQQVVIKPNQYAWTYTNVSTMYQIAKNYQDGLDSHMLKNTEWGAVAYLTQSNYGRCTNNSCTEITINNNSNKVTGYAAKGTTSSTAVTPKSDSTSSVNYTNKDSGVASTTGNHTGIYDMSGGASEYVMGVMYASGNSTPSYGSSGFTNSTFPTESKYYDVYKYQTSYSTYTNRILGDATAETDGWYSDYAGFVGSGYPWFLRGGRYSDGASAGAFYFDYYGGGAYSYNGFRVSLAVASA